MITRSILWMRQPERLIFHILDPKTGYSVETDITSCTIICDSGINSDGLSTACFAMGPEKSQELLKKYNASAIFVDKKNHVYVSGRC